MKILYLIITLSLVVTALTQVPGTWETFADMNYAMSIASFEGKIYTGTKGGILVYKPGSGNIEIMTNIDGLGGLEIVALVVHNGKLYYGCSNGALGRLDGEVWTTYSDLLRANIPVNDLIPAGENLYAATGQGISKLNVLPGYEAVEVAENYMKFGDYESNIAVNRVAADDTVLWVGTDEGLAFGRLGSNLFVPEAWQTIGTDRPITALMADSGGVWFALEQATDMPTIFWTDGIIIDTVSDSWMNDRDIDGFFYYKGEFYATGHSGLFIYDHPGDFDRIQVEGYFPAHRGTVLNDSLYVGLEVGFGVMINDTVWPYAINCPRGGGFTDIAIAPNGDVWVVAHGYGINRFRDGVWTVFDTRSMEPDSSDSISMAVYNTIYKIEAVELDCDGTLWAGTSGYGVYKRFTNGDWEIFDRTNSILTGYPGCENDELCWALAYDDERDVMWITNYFAISNLVAAAFERHGDLENPIVSYYSGVSGFPNNLVYDIAAGSGRIWLVLKDEGVTMVDVGPDLESFSDDFVVNYNDELPSASAKRVDVDTTGKAWVAVAGGVASIDPAFGLVTIQALPENAGSGVNDIVVDKWNNVWITTDQSGAAMYRSSDSSWHAIRTSYTPDILPEERTDLATEVLYAVAFNPTTGDVWFCGEGAISVLHTGLGEGSESDGELVVYPNPFIWYRKATDMVSISGIPSDAHLYIYTPDGQPIRTISVSDRSSISTALWDGRNNAGEPVASGIYLLSAPSSSGTLRGKVALIRGD